jgi:hypothetical protein
LIAPTASGTLPAVAGPSFRALAAIALALASSGCASVQSHGRKCGGGCVTVQPHEREYLALPEMDPSTDALEEMFHSHIESAREGGFGGHRASGGGCGCG